MTYLPTYQNALSPSSDLGSCEGPRAVASDGPALSFAHLDDRRFEILAYRLKAAFGPEQCRVTLMQGVGERGRDVLVYSKTGALKTIVQCKLLRERLTAPDLLRELVKLALFRHLDPTIIAAPVTYEVWCPGDLTEPAASLIDTWPTGWTTSSIEAVANEVLAKFAAFEGLRWADVQASVLSLPTLVEPRKVTAIDISVLLRSRPEIFDDYFVAKTVMAREDVRSELTNIVTAAIAAQPQTPPSVERPPPPFEAFRHPPAPAHFTGREDVLAAVRAALNESSIAMIAGAGGIGKSVIASRIADQIAAVRPAFWIDGDHLAQQLAILAYLFGVTWTPSNPGPLEKALGERACLLIIDNLSFGPAVHGLPTPSANIHIVATTRERGIVPLLPHTTALLDLSALTPDEARRYLRLHVGSPFPWTDVDVDRAAELCGYFPLALTLVAATLRKRLVPVEELVQAFVNEPIETLDSNAGPNDAKVATTFALALARLSPQERATLIGLSVCGPAPWTGMVSVACGLDPDITQLALTTLHGISLAEREGEPPIWRMHDVVRHLCLRQPDAADFAMRHDVVSMNIVASHQSPDEWILVEGSLGEIFVAIARLTHYGLGEEVGSIVRLLIPHLRERGVAAGRNELIESLCHTILPDLVEPSRMRACILGHMGLCAVLRGARTEGDQLLAESLDMYRTLGARDGELTTLVNMAHMDEQDGNLDRAAARYRDAADAFADPEASGMTGVSDDAPRWSATARMQLSRCEAMRGDLSAALREVDVAIAAARSADLVDVLGRSLGYKMNILDGLKRTNEALDIAREALHRMLEAGLVGDAVQHLLRFCSIALFAGYLDNVLQAAGHAVTLATSMDAAQSLARAHGYRAWAFLGMERKNDAIEAIEHAREAASNCDLSGAAQETIDRLAEAIGELPDM